MDNVKECVAAFCIPACAISGIGAGFAIAVWLFYFINPSLGLH